MCDAMCDAYGSSYGHGESNSHGESYCHTYMTGIGSSRSMSLGTPIESFSLWTPSKNTAANARVRHAAQPLERRLRVLSEELTVAEFHALRTRLEDYCDEILLNHLP